MHNFCDDCLEAIVENISQDDLLILEALKKNGTKNSVLAIDKTKIFPLIPGITEFKFQSSVSRLHLALLIGKNTAKRPTKYYITKNGMRIIDMFKQALSK